MSALATAARAATNEIPIDARQRSTLSPHLQRLEDEAIHILREVVAEFRKPVMLYSVGKDSSVMVHLARKAFFPARPPFPFLHIASGWDFKALIEHRDRIAQEYGLELLVHSNQEADRKSTRLNSSHVEISYAVFCLKQKRTRHRQDAASARARPGCRAGADGVLRQRHSFPTRRSSDLARKAFFPARPPFPFLHIASGWDFKALIEHRDRIAQEYGLELLVHSNQE